MSYHSPLAALQFGDPQVIVINGNQTKPVTVTISGRVQDANAEVLTEASITVDDGKKAYLTVDPNTGHYETLPILATNGNIIVECTAPGLFLLSGAWSPCARADTSLEVNFHLNPQTLTATLRGLVYNAKNGRGLPHCQCLRIGSLWRATTLQMSAGSL